MASSGRSVPGVPAARERPYHHGDLRRALLAAAIEVLDEQGPAALSLRDLARRAGVSHAAPAHHFGDRTGLLTAVAAEGYELLADELRGAADAGFLEVGVAYVRFAVAHRAHFSVMFRPELLRTEDAALLAARAVTADLLYGSGGDRRAVEAGVAAWSIVHGFATLWLDGALPGDLGSDPEAAARGVARHLRVAK